MMSGDNDARLLAWSALVEAYALSLREIERELSGQTPLTIDEYDLLLAVSRGPGGRNRLSHLADATALTRGGVTRVVDRLSDRGFLTKESCNEDKRGTFASLTPSGKEAMKETWRHYSEGILQSFGRHFSPHEASTLRTLLERVIGVHREGELVTLSSRKK